MVFRVFECQLLVETTERGADASSECINLPLLFVFLLDFKCEKQKPRCGTGPQRDVAVIRDVAPTDISTGQDQIRKSSSESSTECVRTCSPFLRGVRGRLVLARAADEISYFIEVGIFFVI